MKDETKEELDDLLSRSQNKLLLDCIINLQKENKKLKHSLWEEQELNEYLQDKLDHITNLQEENKRLNNIIDELEKYLETLHWFKLGKKEENGNMEYFYASVSNFYEDIKNILQGSDE